MSGSSFAQARLRANYVFARDVGAAWCRDVAGIRDDALEQLAMPIAQRLFAGSTAREMTTWLRSELAGVGEFARQDVQQLAEVLASGDTASLTTFSV